MRALKAIVIGLGILIAAAVCLLAFGFYKKSTDPAWRLFSTDSPEVAAPAADTPPALIGNVNLNLAPGCRIADVTASDGRAFVRIGPDAACDAVVIVDLADGRVLGRITGQ